jgi:hypothetical protein
VTHEIFDQRSTKEEENGSVQEGIGSGKAFYGLYPSKIERGCFNGKAKT